MCYNIQCNLRILSIFPDFYSIYNKWIMGKRKVSSSGVLAPPFQPFSVGIEKIFPGSQYHFTSKLLWHKGNAIQTAPGCFFCGNELCFIFPKSWQKLQYLSPSVHLIYILRENLNLTKFFFKIKREAGYEVKIEFPRWALGCVDSYGQ